MTRVRYGIISKRPRREKRNLDWTREKGVFPDPGQFLLCVAWELSEGKEMDGKDVKNWFPATYEEVVEACHPEPPLPAWGEGLGPWRYVRVSAIATTSRIDFFWVRLEEFLRGLFGYRKGSVQLGDSIPTWHHWKQGWVKTG